MRAILIASLLSGCSQMADYYQDTTITDIGGRAFFVTPRPQNGAGMYLAGPNDPSMAEALTNSDMTLPAANVAAIEKVTGCGVIDSTVKSTTSGTTFAAVSC